MTNLKKGQGKGRRVVAPQRVREDGSKRGAASRASAALCEASADPFEDDALDAALAQAVVLGAEEPRLLIVDHLLGTIRVRREV